MKELIRKNILGSKSAFSRFLFALIILLLTNNYCFAQLGRSNIDSLLDIDSRVDSKSGLIFSNPTNGVLIKEVRIEGNRLVDSDQILQVINSKVGTIFDKKLVLSDLQAIDSLGYFVRDSIKATPEKTEDGGILLKIRIEENSPITSVQIIGNEVVPSESLLEVVNPLIAKPESITKISEVLDQIEKSYQEKGYLLSRVKGIEVDPDGVLTINVDEGKINEVHIRGNEKTKEKYIKRLAKNLKPGEPYNEILLIQDLRALQATGFFEDIKRSVEPSESEPGKYDLVVEVKEGRTASFGFGGGVNTLSGVFGNLGFNNNNLFGEGKKLSLNTQVGTGILRSAIDDDRFLADERTIQAEARYIDPNFRGTDTVFSLFGNANTLTSYQVDLAQERSFGLGTSFTKPLGMNLFAGLEFLGESVDLREFNNTATEFLEDQLVSVDNGDFLDELVENNALQPGQTTDDRQKALERENARRLAQEIRDEQLEGGTFLHFNPSLSYDTRDKKVDTRDGWNNKLTFGQAVGIGTDSYSKLGIDIRRYVPVGEKSTLAFNVRGATALFGDIPTFNQFKAGGFYGVRGYRPFSDLGIGTRSFLASAEYRTPFVDKLPYLKNTSYADKVKLVLFSDFGYVGGNKDINRLYNRLDVAASAGIGLRANLPLLGPIRVDYGLPLIKPLWDDTGFLGGRFNFGFADRF